MGEGSHFQLDWAERGIRWVGLSEMGKILSQRQDQEGGRGEEVVLRGQRGSLGVVSLPFWEGA